MAGNSVIVDATTAARDGKKPSELLGECPYNARRLHDELQKRGVESHIICGGLDRPSEDGRPTSMKEAEEMGAVHWWGQLPHPTSLGLTASLVEGGACP